MGMLMLYASDMDEAGFICVLTLMMLPESSFYSYKLMSGMGGGSTPSCRYYLNQLEFWEIFMVGRLGLEELSVVSSNVVNL